MSACNKRPPPEHPLHGTSVTCHIHANHDGPCAWEHEPSLARRGLDLLLATFRAREVESIDSQQSEPIIAYGTDGAPRQIAPAGTAGPWVLVRFIGGAQFAIWKETGAVYRLGLDGAVEEDPILTVRS